MISNLPATRQEFGEQLGQGESDRGRGTNGLNKFATEGLREKTNGLTGLNPVSNPL